MNNHKNQLDTIASQIEEMDTEEQVVIVGGKSATVKAGDTNYLCGSNFYKCTVNSNR